MTLLPNPPLEHQLKYLFWTFSVLLGLEDEYGSYQHSYSSLCQAFIPFPWDMGQCLSIYPGCWESLEWKVSDMVTYGQVQVGTSQ